MATPVEEFSKQWSKRLSALQAAGVPTAKLQPVMKYDWTRVQSGSAPFSGMEAQAAIAATLTGKPVTSAPAKPHGLLGMISNIPSDIGDIARGLTKLPGALAHDAMHLGEIPGALSKAAGAAGQGHYGEALRDVAAAPGVQSVVPLALDLVSAVQPELAPFLAPASAGLMALGPASQATTAAGRAQMQEHPVGTLLSILPAAGQVSEAGAAVAKSAGLVDEEAIAGKAPGIAQAKTEAKAPAADLTRGESVYEAAKAGKPLKAAYRAVAPQVVKDAAEGLMRKLHLDEFTRNLNRATAIKKREQNTAHHALMGDIEHFLSDDPTKDAALFDAITRPDLHPPGSLDPEMSALVQRVRDFNDQLRDKSLEKGRLHPLTLGDRTVYYSTAGAEGQVVSAWGKVERAQSALAKARESFRKSAETAQSEHGDVLNRRAATTDRLSARVKTAENRVLHWRSQTGPTAREYEVTAMKDVDRARAELASHEAQPAPKPGQDRASHAKAAERLQKAKAKAEAANQGFMKKLVDTAPAEYHPMLEADLHARAQSKVKGMAERGEITSEALDKTLAEMDTGFYGEYFTPKEFAKLSRDVRRNWLSLVGAGFDPVWVHTVPASRFDSIFSTKVLSDRFFTPTQVKSKVFSPTPRYANVAMALSSAAAEHIQEAAVAEVVTAHILPTARTHAQIIEELKPQLEAATKATAKKGLGPIISPAKEMERLIRENYVEFDPRSYGLRPSNVNRAASEGMWVPKHVHDAIEALSRPEGPKNAIGRVGQKTSSIMKASLFFEPRHLSHVILGGAFAMMLRGGPEEILAVGEAYRMLKAGEVPAGIPMGLDLVSTDELMNYAVGKKVSSVLGKVPKGILHFEEFASNMERVMGYLGELKRQSRKGYSAEHATQLALEHVQKTFVDWDGMTPIERTVIRQYLPFYSFTKYIGRYLITFPIDHPVRAAVFTHISEKESEDWQTGLPQQWQQLFFLGTPDARGNVSVSDIRSINPFRDAGNLFSLTGIVQGLHPGIHVGLAALGVNTLSATPEMYPDVTYDPVSNRLVTTRKSVGLQALETFLPPAGAIDHYLGLTAEMRRLKAADPNAYRRNLFTTLGIPFVPQQVNTSLEMARGERARYQVAATTASKAMQTGDTSKLRHETLVPYQGKLVPGATLAALIDMIHQKAPGISPKAIYTPPKKR